jgi:hypothetical protein
MIAGSRYEERRMRGLPRELLQPRIIGWRKSGVPIWSVAGGSEPPNQPPPADGGAGGTGGTGDAGRTFTQAEVNAMMAQEKRQGKSSALGDVAKTLGMTVDEAAAYIKAAKDAEAAQLSEVEKREREAAEKVAKAEQREAAAKQVELTATITRHLVGVADDKVDDAIALVLRRDVTVESTLEDIKAAVAKVKEAMPALFGDGTPPKTPPRPPGTGDSGPPARHTTPQADWGQAGADEAIRRFKLDPTKVTAT